MNNLAYTVVIPAYNAQKHIGETLQSILDQTILPKKIIVVDDGSEDATVQIVTDISPLVEVISTKNRGQGAATTTGVARVQTPIIAMLDSDDLWMPNKMAKQLELLSDPSLGLDAVLCRLQPFGETNLKTASEESSGWSRSSLTIRTESFYKVGPIKDLENGYGEMIDWFARAKHESLKFHLINEALGLRRIHNESLSFSASKKNQAEDFLKVAMRALERRKLRSNA